MKSNVKPIAVLISDVHYNLQTLPLADASMRQAIAKANDLHVPVIVAGDLHDSKANMRAECVNAMLKTFNEVKTECFILIGNHDLINEKSDTNSLEFLDELNSRIWLVRENMHAYQASVVCIAYHSDTEKLKKLIKSLHPNYAGFPLIMHQGITGSNSGEYIQDKSAISKQDVSGLRIISGHYHQRQTIDLPDGGKWDYIGNPYTLNYGEANDPEKGFRILMQDGSLEFVPTDLRRHHIHEFIAQPCKERMVEIISQSFYSSNVNDLVWAKVRGPKECLNKITKKYIRKHFMHSDNFKLDLIPTDTETKAPDNKKELTQAELLDSMIDSLTNTSDDVKDRLKSKWKDLK